MEEPPRQKKKPTTTKAMCLSVMDNDNNFNFILFYVHVEKGHVGICICLKI